MPSGQSLLTHPLMVDWGEFSSPSFECLLVCLLSFSPVGGVNKKLIRTVGIQAGFLILKINEAAGYVFQRI